MRALQGMPATSNSLLCQICSLRSCKKHRIAMDEHGESKKAEGHKAC